MTHHEKFQRRQQINREYRAGMSVDELAHKYGLHRAYISRIVIHPAKQKPLMPPRKKMPRYTAAEQKANRKELAKKAEQWNRKHVLHCRDFAAGLCAGEHDLANLILCQVGKQDKYAGLCWGKYTANRKEHELLPF